MKMYGYILTSSQDPDGDQQMIAIRSLGIPKEQIFLDQFSDENNSLPAYQKMVVALRENDLLCLKSLDALGPGNQEIQEKWKTLTKEQHADLFVIDMPLLDTRRYKDRMNSFVADIVLEVLTFANRNAREKRHQRQAECIAMAQQKGIQFRRPVIEMPDYFQEMVRQWRAGNLTREEIEETCQISTSTFYRRLRNIGKEITKKFTLWLTNIPCLLYSTSAFFSSENFKNLVIT